MYTHSFFFLSILHTHSAEFAGFQTFPAFYAFCRINRMRFFDGSRDSSNGTFLCAQRAAAAFFRIDLICNETRAMPCGTFLVVNMRLVLIPEISYGRQHRVGRRLAQAAKRSVLDGLYRALQGSSISPSRPSPFTILFNISSMRFVPIRQ